MVALFGEGRGGEGMDGWMDVEMLRCLERGGWAEGRGRWC